MEESAFVNVIATCPSPFCETPTKLALVTVKVIPSIASVLGGGESSSELHALVIAKMITKTKIFQLKLFNFIFKNS